MSFVKYTCKKPYFLSLTDELSNSNTNSKTRSFTSARITVTSARIAAIYKLETARDSLIGAFKSQDKLEVLKTHYEGKLRENKENPVARTILAKIY